MFIRIGEEILISTQNMGFYAEMVNIIFQLSSNTVKALINVHAFIRIITFHREGGGDRGIYKRLGCLSKYLKNQNILFVLSLQYHV